MRLLPWDYGVRNLLRSPWRTVLGAGGIALVALLVLSAVAFVRGMGQSLRASSIGSNVILLGSGSEESVERSEISSAVPGIAAASIPGIVERLGVRYVSPEVHVGIIVTVDEEDTQAMLRGVSDTAYLVHPKVRITEGRPPRAGELLAGKLAGARMGVPDDRLAIGKTIEIDDVAWPIVGRFEAPGTVLEAELWTDLQGLRVAMQRDSVSCVVMTLDDTTELADVDLFTKQRLDLELVAMAENEYYAKLEEFYAPVRAMVWVTAALVTAGAFLGGLNTMYASFAARIRELATLQAIGYGRRALLLSLVQESLLTAALGALAGALIGISLDGVAVRISMGAFGLAVDGVAMAAGLGAGLALGLFGALPAAWRCLRMPVVEALRA